MHTATLPPIGTVLLTEAANVRGRWLVARVCGHSPCGDKTYPVLEYHSPSLGGWLPAEPQPIGEGSGCYQSALEAWCRISTRDAWTWNVRPPAPCENEDAILEALAKGDLMLAAVWAADLSAARARSA